MKKFFLVLSLLLISVLVHASEFDGTKRRYLEKTYDLANETGTSLVKCHFFHRKVIILSSANGGPAVRTVRHMPVSGSRMARLIDESYTEPLQPDGVTICDGGSTKVEAFKENGTSFIVRDMRDCTEGSSTRIGDASRKLRRIANKYCPVGEE